MQHTALSVDGLKGTMSEAELHVLRARLQGGILNKAQRGELFLRPPIGFAYDPLGRLVFDPDQQIQSTLRMLFDTFRRTGSAMATVREFRQSHLLFPRRIQSGPSKGDAIWGKLEHSHVLRVLHNPRYARRVCFWSHPCAERYQRGMPSAAAATRRMAHVHS
jgi:DNA invertase Pin-like site-specific DNA recombinase